ncbi:DUF452 family protein [Porphyromonas circumdentaria]|uniref:Biotin synthesis protein BioG n=1 Tax=Porphyromonas circumdentaria TaxID=29524 RepID=A0A1T4MI29_9PORP|nr:pimeloyl-ACP methyl esterase BioG family protein [Porphyromonas circumdentaria]MBB6275741.1 biotin synthesis protein BioG [Porphyromonas circumdentaria]MDO4721753.1 DUF452 family protein [Porphyromonas circumdentaria]SJZ66669.1 biotin synthesis protein BioG [Porphyromonas circumdentaria]
MRTTLFTSSSEISASRLILFFNGWAMTPASVEHIAIPEGYDLLSVEDYRNDDFSFDFSPYQEVLLVAWSMGVWATQRLSSLQKLPIVAKAVAIAGTPLQRNDEYGIPNATFDATLESLNEENRARFNRRMCGGKRLVHLFEALAQRSTEEIREELARVQGASQITLPTEGEKATLWTKAHVPLKDRIVPPKNQLAYWNRVGVAVETHPTDDHYLFHKIKSWVELV